MTTLLPAPPVISPAPIMLATSISFNSNPAPEGRPDKSITNASKDEAFVLPVNEIELPGNSELLKLNVRTSMSAPSPWEDNHCVATLACCCPLPGVLLAILANRSSMASFRSIACRDPLCSSVTPPGNNAVTRLVLPVLATSVTAPTPIPSLRMISLIDSEPDGIRGWGVPAVMVIPAGEGGGGGAGAGAGAGDGGGAGSTGEGAAEGGGDGTGDVDTLNANTSPISGRAPSSPPSCRVNVKACTPLLAPAWKLTFPALISAWLNVSFSSNTLPFKRSTPSSGSASLAGIVSWSNHPRSRVLAHLRLANRHRDSAFPSPHQAALMPYKKTPHKAAFRG